MSAYAVREISREAYPRSTPLSRRRIMLGVIALAEGTGRSVYGHSRSLPPELGLSSQQMENSAAGRSFAIASSRRAVLCGLRVPCSQLRTDL